MRVTGLDHVVLCVADVEASVAWYRDVLGLDPIRLDEWRSGAAPFVSLRVDATTIIDLLERAPDGTNADHVALVVDELDRAALSERFGDVAPPMQLFGARGVGRGVYVRDPDGHVIELRTYATPDDPA